MKCENTSISKVKTTKMMGQSWKRVQIKVGGGGGGGTHLNKGLLESLSCMYGLIVLTTISQYPIKL